MRLDLGNPAHVKLCLLVQGVRFTPDAVAGVGRRHTERALAYNNSDQPLQGLDTVPGELLLPEGVVCGVNYRPDSPWCVQRQAEGWHLTLDQRPVCEVVLPERPAYYECRLSDGSPASRYVSQYSVHAVAVFLHRQCHMWAIRAPCQFCSVEATRGVNRAVHDAPHGALLTEALVAAVASEPRLRALEWSGGALADFDQGFNEAVDAIDAARAALPRPLSHHLNIMPPQDLSLLARLASVEEPTFALEVWSPRLFEQVCPGKHRLYGRAAYLRAFDAGVALFGAGRMSCNFVAGLEPVDSLIEGCWAMAERGVVPTVAVFHPDKGTPYARKPPPAVDDLLRLAGELRALHRRFGYRPYLVGCRRSSLDSEIYEGRFDA
ncbi:MAG: hypothetical protein HY855_21765 [Burkholderiales bacterium]|nr:hypothetical protein [Burkholderiales bacterium]